ncbi:MAG: hypothetical protein A2979_10080 [Deltaproteobacteria bacterium RIFCSPLOWO2_01_FULL_45_74]|nr:MAG: hypothetical protein A2712_04180 [Deltaproteobacteria bacterium RIFCSPHIGHO2_01_FULL_43_49]OGQ16383.1 MAG: hypothetical protein A3D22_02150 [Deltaproteobacteria bacterium RIFCSPHIGHO2_02_FULL_44_53]OGQ32901.1 MAG: hypothetical protein A2979_10080 [Deltaproteobacteria bacterium RIFCSPLOWO2_01_FULL_45_74]OGQ42002.1 MAG: hypothetical protein A3I70_09865 [Deltaproteobacteria bacterium RIFCSPLOWO2_02_FULL_44_34]
MVVMVACAGRLPSTSKSTSIIRKHFNKYGKKYEASPFGNKKVTNVEILSVDEIHKQLISVQAFVTLEGSDVHKVRVTIEKGPFGWRYVSWENLSSGG